MHRTSPVGEFQHSSTTRTVLKRTIRHRTLCIIPISQPFQPGGPNLVLFNESVRRRERINGLDPGNMFRYLSKTDRCTVSQRPCNARKSFRADRRGTRWELAIRRMIEPEWLHRVSRSSFETNSEISEIIRIRFFFELEREFVCFRKFWRYFFIYIEQAMENSLVYILIVLSKYY